MHISALHIAESAIECDHFCELAVEEPLNVGTIRSVRIAPRAESDLIETHHRAGIAIARALWLSIEEQFHTLFTLRRHERENVPAAKGLCAVEKIRLARHATAFGVDETQRRRSIPAQIKIEPRRVIVLAGCA